MSLPNCIVLATDLAPRTDRAHDRAVTLAREWSAKLIFVHALDAADIRSDQLNEPTIELIRRQARRFLQAEVGNTDDVTPKIVVDDGAVAAVVLEVARVEGADLIVTGNAAKGPIERFVSGSTTGALVRRSKVPVVVVKKRGTRPYRNIIAATDLSELSKTALNAALAWFQPQQVTLYHAFDMPY